MKYLVLLTLLSGMAHAKCTLNTSYSTDSNYEPTTVVRENGKSYSYQHVTSYILSVDGKEVRSRSCKFKNSMMYSDSGNFRRFPQINRSNANLKRFQKSCEKALQKVLKKAQKKYGCTETEVRIMKSQGWQGFSRKPGTITYKEVQNIGDGKVKIKGIYWLDEQARMFYPIMKNSSVDGICKILGFPGGERHDADTKLYLNNHPLAFTPKVDVLSPSDDRKHDHRVFVGLTSQEVYKNVNCYEKLPQTEKEATYEIESRDESYEAPIENQKSRSPSDVPVGSVKG